MAAALQFTSGLLFFPGLIFEAATRARNTLYSAGWLPQDRLSRPVVSVGNITLGGSGKTPFVIYLAETICRLGAVPAVLSRGYGRREQHEVHVVPPKSEIPNPALSLGDEPALIRRRVPAGWLGVSIDRASVAQKILQSIPRPVFVLDDGFQHRRLHRDLDVVIVDRTQPLMKNQVFPRGTLREPLIGLRRAHVIVINGSRRKDQSDSVENLIRKIHPQGRVFHCAQEICALVPFPLWKNSRNGTQRFPSVESAYLVAALGNPERFRNDLGHLGVSVVGARFFRDHKRLNPQGWLQCEKEARRKGARAIITTEKDAIKLTQQPDLPLFVSVQSNQMEEAEEFEAILRNVIGANR